MFLLLFWGGGEEPDGLGPFQFHLCPLPRPPAPPPRAPAPRRSWDLDLRGGLVGGQPRETNRETYVTMFLGE